jgi:DNA-binding winged helix-turn-helix (wHTH) protein
MSTRSNETTPKKNQNLDAQDAQFEETRALLETSSLIYRFGEFTLDVARGCVFKAEEQIRLRPKLYEALKYMVEHPGRLIGKQELMQAVWPDSFVTDDSLVQCILELRRALGDRSQQLLKTVPRRGYLFSAEVIQRPTKSDHPVVSDPFDLSSGRELPQTKSSRKRRNLPVPRTSLIGREQQAMEVSGLLLREDVRLLTLTGPGGAGKTRLAIAVATAIADQFTAGVQFVNLASIKHPDLVATALADALEIQQVVNRTIPQLIGDQLRNSGPFLLLLDNFEQVLPAATVVAEILEACPFLKILVTSRSSLRIYGEQEFPVTPLARDSAIELFVQRAAAVWPDFTITSENAPAIQEICLRLDGLPLAIELAAARTKVLSPNAILDRLQSRLQLLTAGSVDLPERQQTLRNTIEWSHDLLNEAERRLFRRVSVLSAAARWKQQKLSAIQRATFGWISLRVCRRWWTRTWFNTLAVKKSSRVSRCWRQFASTPLIASLIPVSNRPHDEHMRLTVLSSRRKAIQSCLPRIGFAGSRNATLKSIIFGARSTGYSRRKIWSGVCVSA